MLKDLIHKKLYLCIFIILLNTTYASESAFNYWHTTKVNVNLNRQWDLAAEHRIKLDDDDPKVFCNHYDLGLCYKGLGEHLTIGANYRLINVLDSRDERSIENRPHFNLILKGATDSYTLSNRVRFEYREKDKKDNTWRFRNKTSIKIDKIDEILWFKPYLEEEIFIGFEGTRCNQNRLSTGISYKINQYAYSEIYYMWLYKEVKNCWETTNVIGTNLKFCF